MLPGVLLVVIVVGWFLFWWSCLLAGVLLVVIVVGWFLFWWSCLLAGVPLVARFSWLPFGFGQKGVHPVEKSHPAE